MQLNSPTAALQRGGLYDSVLPGCEERLAKGKQLLWKSLSSQICVNFCIFLLFFPHGFQEVRIFLHFTSHETIPTSRNCICWAKLVRFSYIQYHLCCVSSKAHRRATGKAYMHSFSWETWYLFCSRPGQTNPVWNSRIILSVKGFVPGITSSNYSQTHELCKRMGILWGDWLFSFPSTVSHVFYIVPKLAWGKLKIIFYFLFLNLTPQLAAWILQFTSLCYSLLVALSYNSLSAFLLDAWSGDCFLLSSVQIRINFPDISEFILNKISVNRNRNAWSVIRFFMAICSQWADEHFKTKTRPIFIKLKRRQIL